MRESREILYDYVSRARESCAGDSVKGKYEVLKRIDDAIAFAAMCHTGRVFNKLCEIREKMAVVDTYDGRIPIDQELCSILNNDLKKEVRK